MAWAWAVADNARDHGNDDVLGRLIMYVLRRRAAIAGTTLGLMMGGMMGGMGGMMGGGMGAWASGMADDGWRHGRWHARGATH